MIAPNTDIYLIKTPIEIDDMNQLTFSNVNEQYAYFMGCEKLYLDNATYQRKDNVIRFPSGDNYDTNFDQLQRYNYCCYRNESYSDRVFYAFIKNMRYVNDGMTEIEIETDVFQTWQFDIQYKSCKIEREHVNDDTFGKHTYPEGLETGEYISYGEPYVLEYMSNGGVGNSTHCLCMGITGSRGTLINNQYSGLEYIFFKDTPNEGEAWAICNEFINTELAGNDEVIQFIMPIDKTTVTASVSWNYTIGSTGLHYGKFDSSSVAATSKKYLPFDCGTYGKVWDNKLGGGYTPKNNKLLCYPYRYLMLTNNNGGNNIYRFEDFYGQTPGSFQVYAALVPGMSYIAVPVYYKGVEENFSEGLIGAKIPLASWDSDMYTNWLVQNGVNEDLARTAEYEDIQKAYNISQIPFAGNYLVNNTMLGSLAEVAKHAFIPMGSKGNINGGDVNFSLNNNNMKLYDFVIKEEYAKLLDNFFQSYGYKVNEVKIPNITGRLNWNYVKTIECNILGDIPQDDMQKIKQIFNNGVTFWHNPATFLDYSQNNDII